MRDELGFAPKFLAGLANQGLTGLSKAEVEGAWVGYCIGLGQPSYWPYDVSEVWEAYQIHVGQ